MRGRGRERETERERGLFCLLFSLKSSLWGSFFSGPRVRRRTRRWVGRDPQAADSRGGTHEHKTCARNIDCVCYATTLPFRGATKCAAALFQFCSSSSHRVLLDVSAPLFCDSLSLVVTCGRALLFLVVVVVVVCCYCCWREIPAPAHTYTHTHKHTQLPDSPPIETPAQPAHTHTQLPVSPPISMSSSSRYGKHNKRQSHHQSSWVVVVIFSCAIRFCCSFSLPKILAVLKHLVVVRGM